MSHKSEAKYSNITKDRLLYNKTGHFAILVNRRGGGCKIFENGGVQLLGLIIYDDGGGGTFWFIQYIKCPCVHLITRGERVQLGGGGGSSWGGEGSSFMPNVLNSLDIIKKHERHQVWSHIFRGGSSSAPAGVDTRGGGGLWMGVGWTVDLTLRKKGGKKDSNGGLATPLTLTPL